MLCMIFNKPVWKWLCLVSFPDPILRVEGGSGYETRFSLHTFFFCVLDLISDSSFSSLSIFSTCNCVSWDARAFLASISCPRVISSSSLRRELSLESLVVVSSENFTNCMGRKGGTLVSKETQCFNHPLLGGLYQCQTKWLYGACLGFCVSLRSRPNGGMTGFILCLDELHQKEMIMYIF